ncbi:MAG: DMT family transporter [Acidimicrobiia bacterium]|nr:DMT family transporter [Acidimicrobiia bacterium]
MAHRGMEKQLVLGLAIAAAISLGIADYLAGATLLRDGRMNTALVYTMVGSLFGAVLVLFTLPLAPPEAFTANDLLWSLTAGVALAGALPLLMVGMARGPIAVVAPVLGLVSLAVPAILGPLLGDQLTGVETAGLLIAFPAAGLVSLSDHQTEFTAPIPQAVAIASAAGVLFGTSAVCFGQTSTASGIAPGVVAQWTTTVLLFVFAAATHRLIRPRPHALRLAVVVGALTALAVFLSVLAYQRGPVAIVAAVIGLAPGPTVVLARMLAHERMRPIQGVGFALGVVAVVLFAIG